MIHRVPIALLILSIGTTAQACGRYGSAIERREAQQQQTYLAYADKIIRGTWKETSQSNDRDELHAVSGMLIPDAGGEQAGIKLYFIIEINCGFPAFPANGAHGKFYLRAEDISPGDYQVDDVSYNLLHFQADRKKH